MTDDLDDLDPLGGIPDKLTSILDGDVTVDTGVEPAEPKDEEYSYVYRGNALNEDELFRFSAREDVRQVLIAGPQSSGKTTLIVTLYLLFSEGYHHTLRFAGSITIGGFKSRSKKILLASGEAKPSVERTSRSERNRYLHLALMGADGRKDNLILADISGEMFTLDYMEELGELYGNCENVILTVDGEKLQDPIQRHHEVMQAIQLLKNLLKYGIVTKQSKLQIICTKEDLIRKGKRPKETIQYLKEKRDTIQKGYAAEVSSLEFHMISALDLNSETTQKYLEQIMLKCMENVEHKATIPFEEPKLQRYFDKYRTRG